MSAYGATRLLDHGKRLFPLCRSLTGNGTRQTLSYFEEFHPEYQRIKVKSGTKVFDWEVPPEWNIKDAFIEHIDSGQRFAQFGESNLHVVGYSEPIDLILDLGDFTDRIYTLPDQPDWIPYATSYYKRSWGFCMSENQKKTLPCGRYRLRIDSSLSDGELELSHALVQGQSDQEIFFSSYVCHPSMANNELSGPLVLNAIFDYIKTTYPQPKLSYRFVMLPETIGSITYLSLFANELKRNVLCGFNLSCVGDERAYSYVQTPYADTLADQALGAALNGRANVHAYSFLERGSDERQYCSPGIELPVCTFCRSKFGRYPEYHTSADDFSVVTEAGLQGALDVLKLIVDTLETCLFPCCKMPCEPQLGKRGLYPNLSKKSAVKPARTRMNILAFCNGKNSTFDLCKLADLSLDVVVEELRLLLAADLIYDAQNPAFKRL
jgi:aminopeptidase-like protein